MTLATILVGITLFALAGAFVFIVLPLERRRRISKLFELRPLAIEVPKKTEEKDKAEILKEIGKMSQLLGSLSNLKTPFALEVAVHNVGEDILFYLAVPQPAVQFAMNQIHGLWPEAQVKWAEEYTIFQPNGYATGAYFKLKHNYVLPIRTYAEAEIDTFGPILSNFSKLEKIGEGMSLQILVKPALSSAREVITRAIYALKKGEKFSNIIRTFLALNLFLAVMTLVKLEESQAH